jgi:hypothetical protein
MNPITEEHSRISIKQGALLEAGREGKLFVVMHRDLRYHLPEPLGVLLRRWCGGRPGTSGGN